MFATDLFVCLIPETLTSGLNFYNFLWYVYVCTTGITVTNDGIKMFVEVQICKSVLYNYAYTYVCLQPYYIDLAVM